MKKKNKIIILLLSLIISFICSSIGTYIIMVNKDIIGTIIRKINNSEYTEVSLAESVEKIYDAVVVVEGYKDNSIVSTGTGFVYKKDKDKAYIMTNNHVVNGVEEVKIILSNKEIIDAEVKGGETYSDIAVITTDKDEVLSIAKLGNNEQMSTGDTVFAVGSPKGAEYFGSVTKGVLSGKDRLVAVSYSNSVTSDYYMKVMQTDAAINPGNSGGPICNIKGEVIGITNMKLVDNSVEGMGFAIPIEDAIYYALSLETEGKVARPFVGISMIELTNSEYLWQYRDIIPNNIKEGVLILEVEENSPASIAGLKKGDIIIEIDKEKVTSVANFRYVLYKHKPNETIEIKIIRNDKKKKVKLTLAENN